MNVLLSAALVVCWSSGFIGAKLGAGTAPVLTVLMWRFVPLALLLFAFAALRARGAWRGLTAREAAREIVIGALSQSGYVLAVYYAIQLGVSSGTTALIDGIQPLVAGALAGPLLREYVSGRQWAGLCLGVAGAGLVAAADAAGTTAPWWAYAIPVLGMLSLVAATVLEARSPTRVAPAVSMTLHTGTSAVLCAAAALVSGSAVPLGRPGLLGGDALARGRRDTRRVRAVLADAAAGGCHPGQHPDVPDGSGDGRMGRPRVR